ncbi:histidinol-phosphate transaminase [Rhodoferax antarcticus]|uniref:Histidinol-phosphate aminotransferase n=1 Tax=Rhodoferax antarcticus ANT.BR TaxID=1111071 RepID=A0A1Q8YKL7_9BURK|nr:histidinol-phosphate transaminase [Rhodoferax antarcticus]APW47462.1 histidinol-phosphate transaminase [Rhodoferax antarcticus]MCW2311754.1 histidinol-phosphate aminotransferase [Rhodoferax antarcticus]OLP08594.1 histidinol-phosphate aminotransferase [Rhodoferax antarcticus ANT.BR]
MTLSSAVIPGLPRIRADVQAMHAYVVQNADGLIKLDAMENPHRLSLELQAELGQRLGAVALNRYPGPRINDLQAALRRHAGVPQDYGLMLGNGSDELISLLSLACAVPPSAANGQQKACVLAPEPGFVMYAMSAQLQGLDYVGVPLTTDFELDVPAMLAAIAQHCPAITYLAYPNNPSANLWDDAAMEAVIAAAGAQGGLVVIDEAYQPFAASSYLDRLTQHPHVLLLRTLSKFGLAGVRLGYLIGPQALIAQLDKARPPYNVSVLNAEAALFALEHEAVFTAQALDVVAQRALLLEALAQLPGVQVFPSEANMILLRVPDAQKTFDGMKARGVLIKNVSKMHSLLNHCLRLTVGTAPENRQMLAALETSL